jgi:hypothetical protein
MKVISFIEEDEVIEKILRHCGMWKEQAPKPPAPAARIGRNGP